jgi:hypothetical protein
LFRPLKQPLCLFQISKWEKQKMLFVLTKH